MDLETIEIISGFIFATLIYLGISSSLNILFNTRSKKNWRNSIVFSIILGFFTITLFALV